MQEFIKAFNAERKANKGKWVQFSITLGFKLQLSRGCVTVVPWIALSGR